MRGSGLVALLVLSAAGACSQHGPAATAAGSPTPGASKAETGPGAPRVPAVPDGFAAQDATFVSDRTGWVLGTVPCADAEGCEVVAVTRDGGRTWRLAGRPAATGPGELRFANARDGFLLAGGLSVSHDSGRSWRPVDTLRDAIHEPWSAEAARDTLWLTGRVDHGGRALWLGSVRTASFDMAPVTLPDGDGQDLLLSLHGRAVVLAFLDGTTPAAAVSLDGDTFVRRALPCAPSGPLALRTARELVLACDGQVLVSRDAGTTWDALTPASAGAGVPLVTPRSLFLSTDHGLLVSRDSGATWSRALTARIRRAGFESERLGFVIERDGSMRLTRDDGRSWERADFRRTPGS